MYRVTRSGRDVYVGAQEGLMQAARDGSILANDLIYDPTLEKWVFARSLSILTGFTLKGRRQVGQATEEVADIGPLSEDSLRTQNRRRRALAKLGGFVLLVSSTALLIFLLPAEQGVKQQPLSRFAEDDPAQSIRYEGTGSGVDGEGRERSGPSNLDSKAVTIEATEGEPGRAGIHGRRAELDGPAKNPAPTDKAGQGGAPAGGPGQDGESTGGPGQAGDPTGGSAQGGAPTQQGQSQREGTDGAGAANTTPPRKPIAMPSKRVFDDPKPNATPPSSLPVDRGADYRPKVKITPRASKGQLERAKRLSDAIRTLERAKEDSSGIRARELLNARYELELVHRGLQLESTEHPDLKSTKALMDQLSKAFMDLCTSLHSDRFCNVKESNPHWPDVVIRNVVQEAALVGMNMEQLQAAWGAPVRISKERRGRRHCYSEDCKRSALLMGDVVVEVNP